MAERQLPDPIALRQVQVRRTADMQLHEVLAQRITGMTLDARRQGRASRVDTGERAASPGFSAADDELAASLCPCPGPDNRSHDKGFAGLAHPIHVRLTERSLPVSHLLLLHLPWTFSVGFCLPLHALPLFIPLGHVPAHAALRSGLDMTISLLLRPCLPHLFHPPLLSSPPFLLNLLLDNSCQKSSDVFHHISSRESCHCRSFALC